MTIQRCKSKLLRRVKTIMSVVISTLLLCILFIIGLLFAISPGKVKPFVDKSGNVIPESISEKIHISINGIDQGMFIKSKNKSNPVLLFLHGGPGMPEYAINKNYSTGLENYFTVCWWEQRGAGLSYDRNLKPELVTLEQLIFDTIEVTHYLRERFEQEKIYLLAHSWGTFLGIHLVHQSPELYHAYIGMGHYSYQFKSEQLAYQYMIDEYTKVGNKKMVKELEKYPITSMDKMPRNYGQIRDKAMHELGIGTTHQMNSVVSGIFMPIMLNREYTFGEKINIWRGKIFSQKSTELWDIMHDTDLTQTITKLNIPVYFLHGIYDYTVNYSEAKAYYDIIEAPLKGFYTFHQSAHSPLFEEPDFFKQIIQEDVLEGKNNLADER